MSRRTRFISLALAALVAGCDRPLPTGAPDGPLAPLDAFGGRGSAQRAPMERLARRMARAMADPSFRAYVKAELDRSPVVEHKVHFQRFLHSGNRRALRDVARLSGEVEGAVDADAAAVPLEMYLPVPSHRAAWSGGADILVATALTDRDAPAAYDVEGRRRLLSADAPPATPVLAMVPVETDFDAATLRPSALFEDPAPAPPPTTPGLYLSKSHLHETFEGWLKGSPEIEILVMGQKGTTDSLTSYQCIGERAAGSYWFDQNNKDWSGNVLLFSQTQLDNFKAQHPGQAVRLFFMEDDDTACQIKNKNITNVLGIVDAISRGLAGGRDSTSSTLQKIYAAAKIAQKVISGIAGLIQTNDELIGNAVESSVLGEYYAGYNWVLKGENARTNGYINLLMR